MQRNKVIKNIGVHNFSFAAYKKYIVYIYINIVREREKEREIVMSYS